MAEQQVPQISKMMGELVAHQSCFNALPKADRQFVVQQPKMAIKVMIAALKNRPKEPAEHTYRILRPIPPTPTPSLPFRVNDIFLNKENGRVKVGGWGSNFETFFRDKEETAPPVPLQVYIILGEDAYDQKIVADLGGEDAAEIAMIDFWEQIALQGNGESGALRVDGWANIGYAKDAKGVLRTVGADWLSDGWDFHADGFPFPDRWYAGPRVVSPRNS